jgi:protein SCO1
MKALRAFRLVAWCVVAIVTLLLIIGYLLQSGGGKRFGEPDTPSTPAIGRPFELVSHRGQVIDNAVLKGKPYLAFFGFTHCPDICPTTLSELSDLMNELGPAASGFNVVFISVDPERDTQQLLNDYMTSFDRRILALRGTPEQTAKAVKAFSAYARKVPTEDGSYTMDHTAGVYMMDANGSFKGTLDMHESREIRMKKIRNLMTGS